MQELDVKQTVLIVVGSDIRPEEKDRPIAYKLKQAIERLPKYGKLPFRKCIVVSDSLYESDKIIQICPTISIGGPGVNILSAQLMEKLPIYLNQDNRFFIQYDENKESNRVSLWGINQQASDEAVDHFITAGLLNQFIDKIWD